MSFNKIKQAFRILFKEKRITIINITGLSVSLACALFMLLWVEHELSYDRFHDDFKRLYRVEQDLYFSGQEPFHMNNNPYVAGPVWKDEIPEITEQCRMARRGGMLFTYGENKFFEDGIFAVDSSFFEMFSFEFKQGNKGSSLRDPYTMVLTEGIAKKYFGNEDPVGQTIQVDQKHHFTISGVLEDLPHNTVLEFNILIPWSFIQSNNMYTKSWGVNQVRTFVQLLEGSVDTIVNRKVTEVSDINRGQYTIDFMVASLSGIHLHQHYGYGSSSGAILYVYIFSAIALFVLLIACINFINLSTARSSIRAKEIGLQKINGASRQHLIRKHLFESFIQTFISVLLAFMLVLLLLDKFNQVSGKDIIPEGLFSIQYLLGILIILVLTTLLSGIYPALILSGMNPLKAIREQAAQRSSGGLLRKVLVVFQFSLAVLLITGSLVASRQLNYMRNADLGFNKSNLVNIQLRGDLKKEYEMLNEEFTRLPGIISITASYNQLFPIRMSAAGIQWEGKDPEQSIMVSFCGVHYDFTKTMGITMQSGRDFSADFPGDMYMDTISSFILNQTLADIIGIEDVMGMELQFLGSSGQIVGVMEDYHFQPLRNEIKPVALKRNHPESFRHMVVRLDPGDPEGTLHFMEEKWNELLPQYPFEFTYVADVIDDMYRTEERVASLLKIFAIAAILIACLGLYALASFTAERRTHEIGIRKTFGAMERQIIMMMIRDFSLYIIISLVIALPAVWFIARWWLNEFSFRIKLKADIFLLTALITTLVAILTVLYHAIRTARENPVNVLRYE